MKISYYPGCSLEGKAMDYAASIAAAAALMDSRPLLERQGLI
jgi:hypothetical protein